MTEKKLKGLFGGGEADDSPGEPASSEAARSGRGGRRGGGDGGRRGGGGRRRKRSPEEIAQAEDFVNRYTTGNPTEGFSSEEAVGYLRELREEVPPEVLQRAAVQTVQNLPADQRKAFAEMLQRRQAGTGMVTIERTGQARATESRGAQTGGTNDPLGGLFGSLFGETAPPPQQPRQVPQDQGGFGMDDMLGGLLGGLLGGGTAQPEPRGRTSQASDPFGDLLGGLLGGGMGAPAPEPEARRQQPETQAQGGGIGDILASPLGKAVLGGIAAYAMKEMMGQGSKR